MPIKLIAADLDGTLLDPGSQITARTVRAVRDAARAGALFVLNSGRMPHSMRVFYRQLGVHSPMICYNGALTIDPETGRELNAFSLSAETARAVSRMAEDMHLHIQAFWGEDFLFPEPNASTEAYARKAMMPGVALHRPLSEAIDRPVYKLLIITEGASRYEEPFSRAFGDRCRFMTSSPTFLECISPKAGKGGALRRLGESLGIASAEMAAFGDEINDLEMLDAVGYGCAMGNGKSEVLSRARFVVPPNSEDGLARTIEDWLEKGLIGGGGPC